MTVPVSGASVPAPPGGVEHVPPGVTEALRRLDDLEQRPVAEHVEVFDGVHRLLQDALATLDEA